MATPRRLPPEAKTCPDCGTGFTRADGQSDHSWWRTQFCVPCGKTHSRGKPIGKPIGSPNRATAAETRHLLTTGPGDLSWQDHAACNTYDNDLFFPVGTTGPAARQAAEAKAVCRSCPVRSSCLTWALDALEFGIAGGFDEAERADMRQRRRSRLHQSKARAS